MSDVDYTGAYKPDDAETLADAANDGAAPLRIGRYRIERVLGEGGFGRVYLGFDEQLERLVAIKVPHQTWTAQADYVADYLTEARVVAALDHPHIVPVYDVGGTSAYPCFIVSKWIEGPNLALRIKECQLSIRETIRVVATVAEALHYAHRVGVVHRDIKPGNILVDSAGKPYLVDFGLAVREDRNNAEPRMIAGTAPYMSPEQARGEGHRIDGRSDVFSLGVVLYELLTRRRPFKTDPRSKPLEQTTDFEPRPPRQYDDSIPKEIERICLKAMCKRASERYATAKDFADDLRQFLADQNLSQFPTIVTTETAPAGAPAAPSGSGSAASRGSSLVGNFPVKVLPKGLRSFDAADAEFFLELLPGPRDRHGLPDTIRFWKGCIDETDADHTFAVGLIYGPSGCGKSSLVKAGLVPRLADNVIPIYLEASANDTEARLAVYLRERCPELPPDLPLKEQLATLRRDKSVAAGKKILIVLDQFEQWLHATREKHDTDLVQALRQCDGGRVQAIVMVRDDFWMGTTRFMRELEVRLIEGQNSAAVDLFPVRHAEKVLAAFGQAYGALPDSAHNISKGQKDFLQEAARGLAAEGKVVCVRLALFADMMKGKPWTVAVLAEVGGAEGAGERFLEETFSAATAPPEHRYHQPAARAVLDALLPDSGTDIKGHRKSQAELIACAGYTNRPRDFDELMRILDSEVRLITPTDPEEVGEASEEPADRRFQLTHDFLVPALRDWLTRKRKETRRGRTELLLSDRASIWNARPEHRQLPSFVQWAAIQWWAPKKNWTDPQRKMMRHANRYYLQRGLALLLVLVLCGLAGYEGFGRLRAQDLRDRLLEANTSEVPGIVKEMGGYRHWIDPLLRDTYREAAATQDAHKQLHASLALLPADAGQIDYLHRRILDAEPGELMVIRAALREHSAVLSESLWGVAEKPTRVPQERFRVACALALYEPNNPRWRGIAPDVAAALVTQHSLLLMQWTEALQPASAHLIAPLAEFLEDEKRSVAERGLIANIYGVYALKTPGAIERLERRLTEPCPQLSDEAECRRRASIAIALLVIGRGEKVWPLLAHKPDPTLRTCLLERLARAGVDPKLLIHRLDGEADVSVQRALLLSLGDFGLGSLAQAERQNLMPRLHQRFHEHPDAGIHAAIDWLLRKWEALEPDGVKPGLDFEGERRWYVNRAGLTMMRVDRPGEIWLGAGPEKHRQRVGRTYAIAAKEISIAQYLRFNPSHHWEKKSAPALDCPVNAVNWYEAAEFCNWLSAQDDIPQDQWCYLPNGQDKFGPKMKLAPEWWRRTGYRLPTQAEWTHACRAGADTDFAFGSNPGLIHPYAWNTGNSSGLSHPVGGCKPNDFGLFDMHGNCWEWTQDIYDEAAPSGESRDDIDLRGEVDAKVPRVVVGGCWGNLPPLIATSYRIYFVPGYRHGVVGFRPVRTLPVP